MAHTKLKAERVLAALGDPTRRTIVDKLTLRPHSVSSLAAPLGVTLTAVAQHLQVLEDAGLVRTEKVGRVRTAQLHPEGFEVLRKWIDDHRSLAERQFDRLGKFLAEDET
ncbi:MAG TPA: metalloregulator ArsR/SmtB family transcription factor [Caulobacterales bacterium]|nr:metalloregulator ArsR/SmtB family transcription factor [Caulobacterales bacterium]